jgi:P-type conjugative transfer protein TrbJ
MGKRGGKQLRNNLMGLTAIIAFCSFNACTLERAEAGGGASGGAKEWTQLDNKVYLGRQVNQLNESLGHEIEQIANQIEQITNQITMIKDMVYNTANLPSQLIGKVTGAVGRVMNIYNRMDGLLANLSNLDDEFYRRFYSSAESAKLGLEYGWIRNYSNEYYGLSVAMEKKAKNVAESLGVTAEDINDSSKLLEELNQNAASAEGRNAILQAGNDLTGFMSGELVKIRALQAEQTKTYLTYAERQRTLEEAEAAKVADDIFKDITFKENTYESVEHKW